MLDSAAEMVKITDAAAQDAYLGDRCACGNHKRILRPLCHACYFTLPKELRDLIARPGPGGFPGFYRDAIRVLVSRQLIKAEHVEWGTFERELPTWLRERMGLMRAEEVDTALAADERALQPPRGGR